MIVSRFFSAAAAAAVFGPMLAGMMLAGPASAQQSVTDPQALYDRMLRLERDLQAVQRNLYGSASSGEAAGEAAGMAAGAEMEASQAARLSLRLDQIEQSMREITGQVERMQFEVRQVNQRLDAFAADTDYRLRDLEGSGGGARPQGMTSAAPALTPPPQVAGAADERPLSQAQAATIGTLGTVPAGAVQRGAVQGGAVQAGVAAGDSRETPPDEAGPARLAVAPGALAQGSPDEAYSFAMSFLRQGDYPAAEAAFTQFIEAHGGSSLAGNAQYWLGETHYVREQYQAAARAFLTGYQTYASSPKAPDSLLKLGITLMALGQTQDACITLSEVPRTFPNAPQSVKLRAEQERSRAGCT